MTSQPYAVPNVTPDNAQAHRRWPLAVWIPLDIVLAYVLTIVLTIPVFLVYGVMYAASGRSLDALATTLTLGIPPALLLGSLVMQNLAFSGVAITRTRLIRKLPLCWMGFTAPRPWRLIGLGILFGILFVALNIVLGLVFSYFGVESDQSQALFGGVQQNNPLGQVMAALAAVVVAPIGEEIFFRGYVHTALRENSSRRTIAILAAQAGVILGVPILIALALGAVTISDVALLVGAIAGALVIALIVPKPAVRAFILSATIFAVGHLSGISQGATVLLAATFVGGLCLAAARDITGSLLPSIIAHAINNSVGVVEVLYNINTCGRLVCGV